MQMPKIKSTFSPQKLIKPNPALFNLLSCKSAFAVGGKLATWKLGITLSLPRLSHFKPCDNYVVGGSIKNPSPLLWGVRKYCTPEFQFALVAYF